MDSDGVLGFRSLNGALVNLWRPWVAANSDKNGPYILLGYTDLGLNPGGPVGPADVIQFNACPQKTVPPPVLVGYNPATGESTIKFAVINFVYLSPIPSPLVKSWVIVEDVLISGAPPVAYNVLAIGKMPDDVSFKKKGDMISVRPVMTAKNVNWP